VHSNFFRLLALLGLFLVGTGHAAVLDVPANAGRLPVGAALEYFLDETQQLTPEAAMHDPRYRPADQDSLSLGFRDAVLWARLTLHNPADSAIERWLHIEPERLERVSLFLPATGGYRRVENGLQVAVAQRPVPVRSLAFPVLLEAGETITLFLRVQTRTRLSLLPILWSPPAFEHAMQREDLLAMLSIGALLGLGLYAVMMFPLRRDWAALWLGLSMLGICLFEASYNGYDFAYGWVDRPDWSLRAMPVFGLLAGIGFNRFIRALIPFRNFGWWWAGYSFDCLVLADLALLLSFLFAAQFQRLLTIYALLVATNQFSYLGISLAAFRRNFRPAGYLFIGILASFSVFIIPRVGESQGWLPYSSLRVQAVMAAVVYVGNLLFFASISQRVDLLRLEKSAALAEALAIETEAAASMEAQVTERTHQLREAKELAERANLAKGEFLARVSHELRTPLQTILGYAHLLRRDAEGQASDRLALLEEGGSHLTNLVDDLLDYARGERGGLALQPEAAFLCRLLERLKGHGAELADPRRHCFEAHFADKLPDVVRVDARRLEQVVLILLSNAVRYTNNGRINLFVRALAADPEQPFPPDDGNIVELCQIRLRFVVEDSGPGIAASDQERIFDPFERISDGENTGGLGLGLAIARQIVRVMGGELRVESRLGGGSRFWFEISLDLASEEDIPMPFPDLDIMGYAGPKRSILVVEDHAVNRRLLEQLLTELGFAVQTAGGVVDALEWLAGGESFDLALLDQRLPDGSAWDILRGLRGGGEPRPMPVVLLSAQPPHPPHDWGELPGFDAVLLKPASGAEVLECIGGLLGLVWQWANESTTLDNSDEMGRGATPLGFLSAAECAELTELARRGAIYEIEEWLAHTRENQSDCVEFCRKVEHCLAAFDFEGIAAHFDMESHLISSPSPPPGCT